ncbi:hypothetical protein JOC93_000483 [Priestia taiwanensis]|uniref:Uncharacterized protein n=1 Tax=Priestia taiwanensis TaxID=1347902 RepID=A0A917AJD0_9BACI|nr:hypothetical protein [Priestia taiwanensis]GGE57491.1 hypothetical protein GCM10007140_04850 [Priestia taiwanensis]
MKGKTGNPLSDERGKRCCLQLGWYRDVKSSLLENLVGTFLFIEEVMHHQIEKST